MLLLLLYDDPAQIAPTSKTSGPDFKVLREKLLISRSPEDLMSSAGEMRDYCLNLGKDASMKNMGEKGMLAIVETVMRKEDDGVSVKLTNRAGDDAQLAAKLLKLAYSACDNFPESRKKIEDKLAALQSEFPDDNFLSQTVQGYQSLISLGNVNPEKTGKGGSAPSQTQENAPAISEEINVKTKITKTPKTENEETENLSIKKTARKPARQTEEKIIPTENEPPASPTENEPPTSPNENESNSSGHPNTGIQPNSNEPPIKPAPSTVSNEPDSSELKDYDVKGAVTLLQPAAFPAPAMNDADYQKRLTNAKDLASLAKQAKGGPLPDGQTGLDYAKIIFNSATSVDDNGQISLSISSGNKTTTANRQIEMYALAYECVRNDPVQTVAFFQYVDEQYAKASDVVLDAAGKTRLARAQDALGVFCLNALNPSPSSKSSSLTPDALGALLNTTMKTAGLGGLGAGESGVSPELRLQILQTICNYLKADNPSMTILSARALRMFKYDTLQAKQESIVLILKTLHAHPKWKLSEQRLLLEEALRLDKRLELCPPAQRVFNARDPSYDPYQFNAWFKTHPELMMHALLVSSGALLPIHSFSPDNVRPTATTNPPRLDEFATWRWMSMMKEYASGIFGMKGGKASGTRNAKAVDEFKNDRSVSKDYSPQFVSMSLSTLYGTTLARIKESAARFDATLQSQAGADMNELKKLLQ